MGNLRMRSTGRILHNQNRIKSMRIAIAGILCAVSCLVGCSQAPEVPRIVTQSSLVIDTEGHITAHIVDVFDKDYYDLSGLEEMARGELQQFRNTHPGTETAVELQRVETVEGTANEVIVTYTFDNAEVYSDYTGNKLFYGTVAEAREAGYDFEQMNRVLAGAEEGNSMVSGELLKKPMLQRHVVLLEENTRVYAPEKVSYFSENVEPAEDGSMSTAGIFREEYPVVIVLDR